VPILRRTIPFLIAAPGVITLLQASVSVIKEGEGAEKARKAFDKLDAIVDN